MVTENANPECIAVLAETEDNLLLNGASKNDIKSWHR